VLAIRIQNTAWVSGRKAIVWWFPVWSSGTRKRTNIEARRATTPPSLLGIDRRIAYANRKYHSGCMCTGVTSGLAGIKFSESPSAFGKKRAIAIRVASRMKNPKTSL